MVLADVIFAVCAGEGEILGEDGAEGRPIPAFSP
jgi:hypothetical protein